jgi:protein-disulfide isomerase
MALRIAGILFTASVALFGSTCRGQSSGGDVTKDPGAGDTTAADITLDGVDTSMLTPREKKEWSTYVGQFLAPCSNTPVSIAQCVKEKRACDKCVPAAKYILKSVRDGEAREQVETSFKNRFDAAKIKSVNVDESPSRGPENAAITMVEFADFECPHCGLMAPRLDKAVDDRPNDVRFVYKFMPLKGHTHAEPAARAAIAAHRQGKFWPMHHKLYSHQMNLEQADLDSYAKDLGLDITRFHADMQSKETTERLERDRKAADSLEVKGTPTIYINGREYDPQQELSDWFSLELQMQGQKGDAPKPVAVPSGSAAPALSVGPADAGKR